MSCFSIILDIDDDYDGIDDDDVELGGRGFNNLPSKLQKIPNWGFFGFSSGRVLVNFD